MKVRVALLAAIALGAGCLDDVGNDDDDDSGGEGEPEGEGEGEGEGEALDPCVASFGARVCTASCWCPVQPLPSAQDFFAVTAFGVEDALLSSSENNANGLPVDVVISASGGSARLQPALSFVEQAWASSSDDVWLTSSFEDVKHVVNGVVTTEPAIVLFPRDIDGVAAEDIWIVGADAANGDGLAAHFNGLEWSDASGGLGFEGVDAVCALPGGFAWALGDGGTVYRFDGTVWREVFVADSAERGGIFAADDAFVVVGSRNGRITVFDGVTPTELTVPGAVEVTGVAGTSRSEVWISARNSVWRYDGANLSDEIVLPGDDGEFFGYSAIDAAPGALWLAGGHGLAMRVTLDDVATPVGFTFFTEAFRGVAARDGRALIAGPGLIVALEGDVLREVHRDGAMDFKAVTIAADGAGFVVGDDGDPILARVVDDVVDVFRSDADVRFTSVVAFAADDALITGSRFGTPTMGVFDGQAITLFEPSIAFTPEHISACAPNDIYLSGLQSVAHYDGSTFEPLPGFMGNPSAVHCTPDGAVFLATANGVAFRRIAGQWLELGEVAAAAIAGTAANDVWFVGHGGVVHYDGQALTEESPQGFYAGLAVAAPVRGAAIVVGDGGTVMRRSPAQP